MASKRPTSFLRILRLFALAATVMSSINLVSIATFYQNALPTDGIILEFEPTDEAFSPERTPIIAFIDFRNRKQLAIPDSALGTADAYLGQKIPILYSPDAPTYIRINTPIGMWGSGILRLLYGLVPFLFLSLIVGPSKKRGPRRAQKKQRKSTLNVSHLVDHSQITNDTDRPVVRRMR